MGVTDSRELPKIGLTELMIEVTDFGPTEPKKGPTGQNQCSGLTEAEHDGRSPPIGDEMLSDCLAE